MLHLIPAPLHRTALRLAHAARLVWWRLRRPTLIGCRVLTQDDAGHVLLVRHHYGSGNWMLPGGGMKRGEDALLSAGRELAEEVGCQLSDPVLALIAEEPLRGAINRVHVVAGRTQGELRPDGREIAAAGWFDPNDLPEQMSPRQRELLGAWLIAAAAARRA